MDSTIDEKEISSFNKYEDNWWDESGAFSSLHKITPCRIDYIIQVIRRNIISQNIFPNNSICSGLNILDVGCGGGILCEPLSKLGGNITGIDASNNNIEVAKLHSKEMNLDIKYICCSPEKLNLENEFDVILNMEVIEHVENVNLFIKNCSRLIRKNGIMFVATINKNLKSYIFAILGAEYVLRWLPIGTHDWEKFLSPKELKVIADRNDFSSDQTVGMKFNLLSKKWYISKDASVNYISTYLKN